MTLILFLNYGSFIKGVKLHHLQKLGVGMSPMSPLGSAPLSEAKVFTLVHSHPLVQFIAKPPSS